METKQEFKQCLLELREGGRRTNAVDQIEKMIKDSGKENTPGGVLINIMMERTKVLYERVDSRTEYYLSISDKMDILGMSRALEEITELFRVINSYNGMVIRVLHKLNEGER